MYTVHVFEAATRGSSGHELIVSATVSVTPVQGDGVVGGDGGRAFVSATVLVQEQLVMLALVIFLKVAVSPTKYLLLLQDQGF